MGLCSSQSRRARIPQERSFSGYFWLTQRQEVQEILRKAWLKRLLAQEEPRRPVGADEVLALTD